MSETSHRWYVVQYQSKQDPSQGIDYTFGKKPQESACFPTEQAAYAIQSLMSPGVTFALADGRQLTIYEFGIEKIEEYKYAIYTGRDVPTNLMGQVQSSNKTKA